MHHDAPRLHRHWLDASGGLIWHLRALRYRQGLWRDFRCTVRGWLHTWQPPVERLLIVGPSAGHTLDAAFLARWREIVVLEPDPLARWLLRRRYPAVPWRFDTLDALGHDGEGFAALAHQYPRHAILFANVLGQVAPREDFHARRWCASLRAGLSRHYWASYHDVISTRRAPDVQEAAAWQNVTPGMALEEVVAHFWRGGEIALVDHATFGLGEPGRLAEYRVWPLRPSHYHLVEWLAH